jgi:hypothetical protein
MDEERRQQRREYQRLYQMSRRRRIREEREERRIRISHPAVEMDEERRQQRREYQRLYQMSRRRRIREEREERRHREVIDTRDNVAEDMQVENLTLQIPLQEVVGRISNSENLALEEEEVMDIPEDGPQLLQEVMDTRDREVIDTRDNVQEEEVMNIPEDEPQPLQEAIDTRDREVIDTRDNVAEDIQFRNLTLQAIEGNEVAVQGEPENFEAIIEGDEPAVPTNPFIDNNNIREYSLQRLDIGYMNCICEFCGAYYWDKEKIQRPPIYTRCCSKGTISLPEIRPPPLYIQNLLRGIGNHGKLFKKHSRIINTKVSFASVTMKTEQFSSTRGVSRLRVGGSIYHNIGSIFVIYLLS